MEVHHKAERSSSSIRMSSGNEEDVANLRRGPWTVDEDLTLINHIANHGEGRWNSLARDSGLKRTGKSCRLRWLNYLHPDVRRGNITLEEQLLILELHSQWGNQWSKIAQHLPGRTDNEIKNYWRTRVQKHTKQLKCDVGSRQFKDVMKYLWMPRLVERIQASAGNPSITSHEGSTITAATAMYRPRHTTAAMHVQGYTGTDPENSCATPSSSEYSNPFYTAHEASDPNYNEYCPVPAAAYGNSLGEEDRGHHQGLSGSFDHAGYYHQFNHGMEFQVMDDDHHRQQNHHDSNDQIQRCWSEDVGRSPPDNLWNHVFEDVNYWSLQNSAFDP